MNLLHRGLGLSAIIVSILIPFNAQATNGYFLIGFGAKSRGMGGVGVAQGVDGLAAANNPATMIDVAARFDIGGDLFSAPRAVTHSEGQLSETVIVEHSTSEDTAFSHNDLFLIPNMGAVYRYSDELTYGFSFIGAGAATNYNQALPAGNSSYFFNFNNNGGDDRVGVKLLQLQIPLSIAYKVNNQNAIGASLVIAAQFFEAVGLGAFDADSLNFGLTPNNITNNGTDHSYGGGIRLGWKGRYMNGMLHIGVNYSSRVYMSEFERYRNLFAEQGDFDIPENYAVGVAYQVHPKVMLKADIQRINYNDIASVGNPGPLASDPDEFNPLCPGSDADVCKLGGDLGLGFGWTNQTIYKIGIEYMYSNVIQLRAGYNHGDATIPPDQVLFNALAPVTVEDHLTFGGTYMLDKDMELSMSYVHGFENTISGPTPFPPAGSDPALLVNNAALSMKQRSLGFELGIKF